MSDPDDELVTPKRHLTSALADQVTVPALGSRWQPQADKIRASIRTLTSNRQALHFAQREITFDHRTSVQREISYLPIYEREIKWEFPWFSEALDLLSDNPEATGESITPDRGRFISNVLFYHARILFECLSIVKAPSAVLEIGGGYGALARLWLNNPIHIPDLYIIVDAPECLFFAESALRAEFGSQVAYAGEDSVPDHRILLVPFTRLDTLKGRPINLLVNTGSMQEMTDEWIDFYMAWLDERSPDWFYSLNYAAQPINLLGESRNIWGPRPSRVWAARLLFLNPAILRFQSAGRDWLSAIYQRDDFNGATDSRCEWLRNTRITRDTYVHWLDAFRRTGDVDLMHDLLRRVELELRYWPKEMLWVAQALLKTEWRSEAEPLVRQLAQMRGGVV
jgi:putative sugar O-methyltransferase